MKIMKNIEIDGLKYEIHPFDIYCKHGNFFVRIEHEGYYYNNMPKKYSDDMKELIQNINDDCVVIIARRIKK